MPRALNSEAVRRDRSAELGKSHVARSHGMREDPVIEIDGRTAVLGLANDETAFVFGCNVEAARLAVGAKKDLIAGTKIDRTREGLIEPDDSFAALEASRAGILDRRHWRERNARRDVATVTSTKTLNERVRRD